MTHVKIKEQNLELKLFYRRISGGKNLSRSAVETSGHLVLATFSHTLTHTYTHI